MYAYLLHHVLVDSIIFVGPEDPDQQGVKLGSALGDLTSELEDGEFIVEFVCTGGIKFCVVYEF